MRCGDVVGDGEPDRVRQPLAGLSQSRNSWVPPAESVRISTCRGRPPPAGAGSWASASRVDGDVVGGGVGAGVPGRSRPASGSPVPSGP